jgi:hypothetical protein
MHEQGQRVGRERYLVHLDMRPDGRGYVHLAGLELGAQSGELLVLEVVLGRERLERALLDRPTLIGLGEESLDRLFENCAQDALLSVASCRRRSNRSMRLPVAAARSTPVYAG